MAKRTVLVTGGAGYVGSHTCAALARHGFLPVAFDDLSRGYASRVCWGPLEQGSILDADRLGAVLRTYRPIAVMHFAGLTDGSESLRCPERYQEVNVAGTRTLTDTMRIAAVRRLIFSSSAAVYGQHTGALSERDAKSPANPYGASKLAAESIIANWAADGDGCGIALRYFNAAGSSSNDPIGEYFEDPGHLIPRALLAARCDHIFEQYGADWPTRDGSCVRDFVHVEDLAMAHVFALEKTLAQPEQFRAINLGSGMGYSVRDVVEAVRRITGQPLRLRVQPRRPGDVAAVVADARLARDVLGWQPQQSTLESIIGSSWRWLLQDRWSERSSADLATGVRAADGGRR